MAYANLGTGEIERLQAADFSTSLIRDRRKTTVTTVEPGLAPSPPPRSIRSQSTVDPKDDPAAWVPCADGGFVRQRIDDLNQADVSRVSVETEDAKLASGARWHHEESAGLPRREGPAVACAAANPCALSLLPRRHQGSGN